MTPWNLNRASDFRLWESGPAARNSTPKGLAWKSTAILSPRVIDVVTAVVDHWSIKVDANVGQNLNWTAIRIAQPPSTKTKGTKDLKGTYNRRRTSHPQKESDYRSTNNVQNKVATIEHYFFKTTFSHPNQLGVPQSISIKAKCLLRVRGAEPRAREAAPQAAAAGGVWLLRARKKMKKRAIVILIIIIIK